MNMQRAQRIAAGLVILIVLFILVSALTLVGDAGIGNREKRIYIILFLFLMTSVVIILTLLRNSVIANTAFLIRLRDKMNSHGKSLDDLQRSNMQLTKELTQLNKTLKNEEATGTKTA